MSLALDLCQFRFLWLTQKKDTLTVNDMFYSVTKYTDITWFYGAAAAAANSYNFCVYFNLCLVYVFMNFEGARMLPQSIHLIMPHLMQRGLQKS
jgi:hypothetical protein